MSIVKAKTNQYGPATLDLQIEQGADFVLNMSLKRGLIPWDLTGATFDAHMSTEWAPGGTRVDWGVALVGLATLGAIVITYRAAAQAALVGLPHPPKKTVDQTPFTLGGWVLNITQGGVTERIFSGTVTLARDPCLT